MFGNLTKLSPNESLYVLNIRQFQKLWFGTQIMYMVSVGLESSVVFLVALTFD